MLIKDMFVKPIDREIKGVVKVGQDDIEVVKQDLEEYVVTKELQKHFRDFFSSYISGINNNTDKVGVWIAGFFGSGKSHFLKILSYLLENRIIDNKRTIDYFLEDEKINDPMIIADMELASSIPTDVILFNIDSKNKSSAEQSDKNILNVFLTVFNEKLGYSSDPHLADLERQLDEDGLYEEFKSTYKKLVGEEWVSKRHRFNYFHDNAIKTLVEMEFMSLESAQNWARSTINPYKMSIIEFAELVNKYLDSKGEDHHIIFLVDEIGQYIANNTGLMLNLQTITEDLGTLSQGRAWIVVTSQQNIDSITEVVGDDFSKIQGRFDTRLSLTSANVDEVIKLRILDKTEKAKEQLSVLYENKETIIKNLIIFNDPVEKKLYEDKINFSEVYPFIPYQFDILGNVLTSIRQHGAKGKSLADGERSMLALIKESAEKIMECHDGEIVPFSQFYGGIENYVDHTHSVVITKARNNRIVNPDEEKESFNVEVLKALFMIKYVKEIEANLENITTLMVSNIDDDRRLLKEKVEEALNILVTQMLVQKNGNIYIFLTDEEQELNREIESQDIITSDILRKISELIFDDIYTEDKVGSDTFENNYLFNFNRAVDDIPYKSNQDFDFGVKIVTPYSELNGLESNLRMNSSTGENVLVDLPNDDEFIKELRLSMKIGKFLSSSSSTSIPKFAEIRDMKRREMSEHQERAKIYLETALKESQFYVNGDLLEINTKDFKQKLTESLGRLVNSIYHKLNYITEPMDKTDIHSLFKQGPGTQIVLDDGTSPNKNAISEVLRTITTTTKSHTKISLKEIKNRYSKAPYGFSETDIEWIIAKSFKDGKIGLILNGQTVSLINQTPEKIIDYITKRMYVEKLLIEVKEIIPEHMKRSLKTVTNELFKTTVTTEDTDKMVIQFNKLAERMVSDLNDRLQDYDKGKYPGKNIIEIGVKLVQGTTAMYKSKDIFNYIYNHEIDYIEFSEDYTKIKYFLEGDQREIWDEAQLYLDIFNQSKSYIVDEEIESIVEQMESIFKMSIPYNKIAKLKELNTKFSYIYNEILEKELEPVKEVIDESEERVVQVLQENKFENESKFHEKYHRAFSNLMEKAKSANNVAQVNGFRIEADALKTRYLNEINKEIKKLAEERRRAKERRGQQQIKNGDDPVTPPVVVKEQYSISIKDINSSSTWRIESEEDLEEYLQILKEKIGKEIKDDVIIKIEF